MTELPEKDIPVVVYQLFESYAFVVLKSGHTRYSADAILHRIRWHMAVEQGDREFKVNNNWSSRLARWFLKKHPKHEGFFELRRRKEKLIPAREARGDAWNPEVAMAV